MRTVIGIMGGGSCSQVVADGARDMGRLVAEAGHVLLNGGRDAGVMAASAEGAASVGGLVIGVLPTEERECVAPGVTVAIPTGLGDARNAINVLASHVVVAFPGGAGTISEIALALKAARPVVTVDFPLGAEFDAYRRNGLLFDASSPHEAMAHVRDLLEAGVR